VDIGSSAMSIGSQRRMLKTSEHIALEIVRAIVERKLEVGDRLPREAEMVAHYQASRSSVREALRLLEVQGLIRIRPGAHAGTIVGEVRSQNLARTLTLYMHMEGTTYDEVLESWVIMEPVLAELAARCSDRELVATTMSRFVDETPDDPASGQAFHDAVALLAGNRALTLVVKAVGFIFSQHILDEADSIDHAIAGEHSDIAKAIIAGDTAQARDLMRQHARHVEEIYRSRWPEKVGERIRSQ